MSYFYSWGKMITFDFAHITFKNSSQRVSCQNLLLVLPEFLLRMFDCTCLKAVNSTWIQGITLKSTYLKTSNNNVSKAHNLNQAQQLVNFTWTALSVSGDDDASKALLHLLTNIWTDFWLITMNTFSCAFVVNTEIANSAQTEYCPSFPCVCVSHRRDISSFLDNLTV